MQALRPALHLVTRQLTGALWAQPGARVPRVPGERERGEGRGHPLPAVPHVLPPRLPAKGPHPQQEAARLDLQPKPGCAMTGCWGLCGVRLVAGVAF